MTLDQRATFQRSVIRHDLDALRWFKNHPLRTTAVLHPVRSLNTARARDQRVLYLWSQLQWTRAELSETTAAIKLRNERRAAARARAQEKAKARREAAAAEKAQAAQEEALGSALYAKWNYLVENCEAGGAGWWANTGNGFFFGPQFTSGTWHANGGGLVLEMDGIGLPMRDYSIAQIIRVAESTLRTQGPGAWPSCHARGFI